MSRRMIALAVAVAAYSADAMSGGTARAQSAGAARPEPTGAAPADPGAPVPAALDPGASAAPASSPAPASVATPEAPAAATGDSELGDQGISAALGLASGGRVTPGGLRIAGHYLYQLSERDWFDGAASFTFGSGAAACFRDRSDAVVCNHGLADGSGVELSVSVRRLLAPQGAFRPFIALGVGLGVVRFSGDDVTGVTVPLHGGGGVRVQVAPSVAVVAEGLLELGLGRFGRGLGAEPQASLAVTAAAEFRLR